MKRLLSFLSLLLSLALAVVVVLLLLVTLVAIELDATPFKDRLAGVVAERTGVVLGIDGRLTLITGPRLRLRATDLSVSLPTPGDGEPVRVDAGRAALGLATAALLGGRLRPTELLLADAQIAVAAGGSGKATTPGARERAGQPAFALPPIRLSNTRILLPPGATGAPDHLLIEQAVLHPIDADGYRLRVDLEGRVDGTPLRLRGRIGMLRPGAAGLLLDLRVDTLGLTLAVAGELSRIGGAPAVNLRLGIDSPSLAERMQWPSAVGLGDAPLTARLRVRGGEPRFELTLEALRLGELRLSGLGYLDLAGERPGLRLELKTDTLDIRPWLRERARRRSGRDGNHRLADLGWLDQVDVDLKLDIHRLVLTGAEVPAALDLKLHPRRSRVALTSVGGGGAARTVTLTLERGEGLPLLALEADLGRLALAPLLAAGPVAGLIDGHLDARVSLRSRGGSAEAIIDGLSGSVLLSVTDASADLRHIDRMTPGLRDLFGLLARSEARQARINCALGSLAVADGRVALDALVDTADALVLANGGIDLRSRTLDLRLVPKPKGAHLKVAAVVAVDGPLAKPRIGVEKTDLLVALTRIAAKVALPELLLAEAFGSALEQSPCLRAASTGPIKRLIEARPAATVVGEAAGAVDNVGAGLRDGGKRVIDGAGGLLDGLRRQAPPARGPSGFEVE